MTTDVTIGGSQAAAAVGLDPFKSQVALWAELTGRLEPREAGGPTAEMSIINPAYSKALDVLAQIEREDAERREDTEMPDDMPDEDFYIAGDQ